MKDTYIIAAIAPDAISLMDKAIAEIKRLRQENATLTAERDEARREVCAILGGKGGRSSSNSPDAYTVANERGWDCYKEKTK